MPINYDSIRRVIEMSQPQDEQDTDDLLTDEQMLDDMPDDDAQYGETYQAPPADFEPEPEPPEEPALEVDDEELARLIGMEIEQAENYQDSVSQQRDTNWDYFYGRLPAQTDPGRSGVVSKDVADMVEATLSQVLQAFASDEIVSFEALGPGDEDQAEQESRFVSRVFMKDCAGSQLMYSSFKDALVGGLGIGKAYWCEKKEVTFDEYHGLNEMQLPMAMQPREQGEQVEVVGQEQGEGGISIKIKRTKSEGKPSVISVDPDNFLYTPNHDALFLDEVPFCAERRILTASDLIDLGYDEALVAELPTYYEAEDRRAKADDYDQAVNVSHDSVRPIETYECYYRVDRDGDGLAELVRAIWSNDRLLEAEETDAIPYALACPFPVPHEVVGESLADKMRQIQDTKTAFLRIAVDNGLVMTYGRYEIAEGMVNVQDFSTPKPGGYVRSKRIGSVVGLPSTSTADVPLQIMGYMDKMRTEGGGPALDMQGQNIPVNTQTAHGTERVMTAMEQMASRIAQTFADTFLVPMFRQLHRLLMKYGQGELQMQQPNGEFTMTDPRNWIERPNVGITVGKTHGEKMRQAQALQFILQAQQQIMQMGGDQVLVTMAGIHNALVDLGRAFDISTPQQYWVDPASQQGQQAAQQKAQQAQAAQQAQQQQMQMLIGIQQEIEAQKEQTKRMAAQLKYQQAQEDRIAEIGEALGELAFKLTELEANTRTELSKQHSENVRALRQSNG